MRTPLLIVVAVSAEADAIGRVDGAEIVVSGIGRTNAACATTESLLDRAYGAVLNAGVAGSLPPFDFALGSAILA